MIEQLTPEQEAMIPVYLEEFLKIGLSTEKCDRAKAEKAVRDSYIYQKRDVTNLEFIWADSPFKGAVIAAQLAKGDENVTDKEIQEQAGMASYGSFEAYWGSFYCYIAEQLPVQKDELAQIVRDIMTHCGVYWTFEDVVVMTEKPTEIHMLDKKLHNENGLALKYADGTGIYALNGNVYNSMLEMIIQAEMEKRDTTKKEENK